MQCQFIIHHLSFIIKYIMVVKIINTSQNALPAYETEGSAGMDMRANITEPITLKPLERFMIPTGLFIELPLGYEAQVRPRSGLAAKRGLTCLNSPGTIDADYRGELKVILVNLSNEEQTIEVGERVAQMVIAKHERVIFEVVEVLSETVRGAGGFGSTGTK
jgi:dUTP pyrophosphatase